MKQLVARMLVFVVGLPLSVLGGIWVGYLTEQPVGSTLYVVSDWLLLNTPVETVLPPPNTTVIYKSDRLACDGRGE